MSAAIFYPGFICGAYPAIVLAQRYPIERVIFGIVLLWGTSPTIAFHTVTETMCDLRTDDF